MDDDVEGKIGPRHSSGQARRRQDIQDQSAMGRPGTYCHQRRNAEIELVWSTLFVFPFGILSDKKQFPTVWVCGCTKGCRKVYEKKGSGWSAIMDHLAKVHGIAKDATHPTNISRLQKKAREECKCLHELILTCYLPLRRCPKFP